MLKTNSKKALENITKEILNQFDPDELHHLIDEYNTYNIDNYAPVLSITDFIANYYCCNNWTWYDNQREILKQALEESEDEANKYSQDKVSSLFYYLFDKCILNYLGCEVRHYFHTENRLRTYPQIVKKEYK